MNPEKSERRKSVIIALVIGGIVGAVLVAALFVLLRFVLGMNAEAAPAVRPVGRAGDPPRFYHSVAEVLLPDDGPIVSRDSIPYLDYSKPTDLVVTVGRDGVVVLPVLVWGWSTSPEHESADVTHNGTTDEDDWRTFRDWFEAGDARADFNADGFVSGEDFDEFQRAYERSASGPL